MDEEINLKKFSERFSGLIKNSSIEIPELAKMLGIKSKSTIYRYMNGEMSPKISTIKYMAEIFNVNPRWLMGYDAPKELEPLYKALYDFSTEKDRQILNNAILYCIQNEIPAKDIPKNVKILEYLKNLEKLNKSKALQVIKNLSLEFKGKIDFDLKEYISSLYYKSNSNKIDINDLDMAFATGIKGLNKENQEVLKNIMEGLLAKQEKDKKENNKK